jgi:hypothetical protein
MTLITGGNGFPSTKPGCRHAAGACPEPVTLRSGIGRSLLIPITAQSAMWITGWCATTLSVEFGEASQQKVAEHRDAL